MGDVYLAHHDRLGFDVALKILRDFDEPGRRARFARESAMLGRLEHRNIVRIHEVGSLDDDAPVIVFEFIDGVSLRDLLRRTGPLPWLDVARSWYYALDGLGTAHDAGIVHRDIKPSNLLIQARGPSSLRIIDFGVARPVEVQTDDLQTGLGTVVGTPRYLTPEQLVGQPVGPQTDIYSLGVTVYEALRGELQDYGSVLENMVARLREPLSLDALTERGVELPGPLRDLLVASTEPVPTERPSDARDCAAIVRAALEDAGVAFGASIPWSEYVTQSIVATQASAGSGDRFGTTLDSAEASEERSVTPFQRVESRVRSAVHLVADGVAREPDRRTEQMSDFARTETGHRFTEGCRVVRADLSADILDDADERAWLTRVSDFVGRGYRVDDMWIAVVVPNEALALGAAVRALESSIKSRYHGHGVGLRRIVVDGLGAAEVRAAVGGDELPSWLVELVRERTGA